MHLTRLFLNSSTDARPAGDGVVVVHDAKCEWWFEACLDVSRSVDGVLLEGERHKPPPWRTRLEPPGTNGGQCELVDTGGEVATDDLRVSHRAVGAHRDIQSDGRPLVPSRPWLDSLGRRRVEHVIRRIRRGRVL